MTERQFQIAFERQLQSIVPGYNTTIKLTSDMIFHYINRSKDEYVKSLYRVFQQNQEITDKLRTLVKTVSTYFNAAIKEGNRWYYEYPKDYLFTLGEEVEIRMCKNNCPDIVTKTRDVIEATIETVDRILENSLSEYHLHHNQARPVRLYTDSKIVLITDGKYGINKYSMTYLRKAKDLGENLKEEYTELPEVTHQEIVDAAVRLYLSEAASTKSDRSDD